MNRFTKITTILLGIAVAGAGIWWLGRSSSTDAEPSAEEPSHTVPDVVELDPESLQLADLSIEPVAVRPLTRTLTLYGQIEAYPEAVVNLNSRVTGRVLELRAHVGQWVRRGQVLAVLDSEEIHRAEINYAQAKRKVAFAQAELARRKRLAQLGAYSNPALEEARSRWNQAQAEYRAAEAEHQAAQQAVRQAEAERHRAQVALSQAESQFARAERLLHAQLISKQEYESLQTQRESARAALQIAQAQLESAQARLQHAAARLENTRTQQQIAQQQLQRAQQIYQGQYLTSKEIADAEAQLAQAQLELEAALDELNLLGGKPNGGHKLTLTAPFDGRIAELRVTVGETVTPDKPIFRIVNTDAVWVSFDLYPEDVPFVKPGALVEFTLSSGVGKRYTAEIQMIMPEADPHTRTVKARGMVRNPDGALKPGTFVEGKLTLRITEPQVAVPPIAVHEIEGKPCVFVATESPNRFVIREVALGVRNDTHVVVRAGLKPNERIVVRNSSLLKGMLIGGEGGGH